MKKWYMILICMVCAGFGNLHAQNTYEGAITFGQQQVTRKGGQVNVNMKLSLSDIKLGGQQMIRLTPVLQSKDGMESYVFPPVVVAGTKRYKVLMRELDFGTVHFERDPMMIEKRRNGKQQVLDFRLEAPYKSWMHNAELTFREHITGCDDCDAGRKEYVVMTSVLDELFIPRYELSYITPPVEPVKQRSEAYSAYLNFELDKYKLLRDYKNNTNVLDEVDRIVNEIQSDPNLTVTEFKVTGYASPEGNYQSNMTLSKNRAYAFVNYLKEKRGVNEALLTVDWKGEDWQGLRKAVAVSDIAEKDAVLAILNGETNIAKRKQKLHALNGGKTYRMLLQEYYPPLRRNDYTIAYVARAFNVEEARELIKTKPHHLSLNEMFLVANTYPKGSKEFKEVFDIAARMYPDEPVAQLNTAATELENGATDAAIVRLQKLDMPEAWNNLGIAYILKKDYRKGEEFFKKAEDAGVQAASHNLAQLSRWLETRE